MAVGTPRSLVFTEIPPTPFAYLKRKYEHTVHCALFLYSFEYLCCNVEQSDVAQFVSESGPSVWLAPRTCPVAVKTVLEAALSTVEMLVQGADNWLTYMLRLFGDRFLPLTLWLRGHTVVDVRDLCHRAWAVLPKQTCLFADTCAARVPFAHTSHFWSRDNSKQKRNPLIHLLSKCLPQRCQGRNLNRVTELYLEEHSSLAKQLHAIVLCSLLGNYESNANRPSMSIRQAIFQHLYEVDSIHMLVKKHFNIVVFALKQFIRCQIDTMPQLRLLLIKTVNWLLFERCTATAMNAVCGEISASPAVSFLRRVSVSLEQCVSRKNNRLCAPKKRPNSNRFVRSLVFKKDECDVLKRHFTIIYNCMCRVPLTAETPWYLLVTLGVPRDVVRSLYNERDKTRLRALLDEEQRTVVRRFLNTFDLRHSLQLYDIPHHHCEQQDKALRKRFSIADGDELPDNVGQFVLCTQCKTLKSYSKTQTGTYGNSCVLINDETLEYYCSQHKSNKNNVAGNSAPVSSFLKHVQPERKVRKRVDKYAHCESTALLKMPSRGKLLFFFGHLYMLCPQCAATTRLDDMGYRGVFFACSGCMGDQK